MVSTIETLTKCGKCGGTLDTKDTKSTDRWCRKCRADYQRDYQNRRWEEAKGEGFQEGVEACRRYLMQQFTKYPLGQFSGMDIINYIRQFTMPKSNPTGDVSSSKLHNQVPLR